MKNKRAILWFRNDLRLHDNEALHDALRHANEVVPVFVFDERIFNGKTSFGFPKIGKFRAQFLLEAVEDLRKNLQKLGNELYIRVGKPEEVIFEIAQTIKSSWVFCNRERTTEEVRTQDYLEKKLWSVGQEIRFARGKMLYYTADLPFPVTHTPDVFTQFRKEVERITPIRPPLSIPSKIPALSQFLPSGELPTLETFGHQPFETDLRSAIRFKGGETEGLKRLQYYLWDSNKIRTYEESRNGLVGADYSSKLSAWLSTGCLSPKMIYIELKRYEKERCANKSTYWLFFELLWRDFFRLMGKKYGNKIFQLGGTLGKPDKQWQIDKRIFQLWADGKTGIPFIDANMRELKATGFMSNRGRQNVASFLIKDLNINWLMGAEWFESLLIDYDPCSNYGNWNYVAGVGNDPRENRYFNIISQAQRYDTQCEFVRLWCPELQNVPTEKIHRPDLWSVAEQEKLHVQLGASYPKPMVQMAKWAS